MDAQPQTTPVCIPRDLQLQAAMFRLGHIEDEIRSGYEILRKYHKTVTIFGSARTSPDNPYYLAAKQAAEQILSKADQLTDHLLALRTLRLKAKQQIRAHAAKGNPDLARRASDDALAAIRELVSGQTF